MANSTSSFSICVLKAGFLVPRLIDIFGVVRRKFVVIFLSGCCRLGELGLEAVGSTSLGAESRSETVALLLEGLVRHHCAGSAQLREGRLPPPGP
jgi:hypothetical protein